MSFPDEAAFHAWADSPEYLEISKDRKAGAQGIVLLVRDLRQRPNHITTAQSQIRRRTAPAH